MNRLRKILSLTLAATLILSLTGCKGKTDEDKNNPIKATQEQEDLLNKTKAYNIFGDIIFTPTDTNDKNIHKFAYRINADIDLNSTDDSKPHSYGLLKYSENGEDEDWQNITEFYTYDSLYYLNYYNYILYKDGEEEFLKYCDAVQEPFVQRDLLYSQSSKVSPEGSDNLSIIKPIIDTMFSRFYIDNLIKEKVITTKTQKETSAVTFNINSKDFVSFVDKYFNDIKDENSELFKNIEKIYNDNKLPEDSDFINEINNYIFSNSDAWESIKNEDKLKTLTNDTITSFNISVDRTIGDNGTRFYALSGDIVYNGIAYTISGNIELSSIPAFKYVQINNYTSYDSYNDYFINKAIQENQEEIVVKPADEALKEIEKENPETAQIIKDKINQMINSQQSEETTSKEE